MREIQHPRVEMMADDDFGKSEMDGDQARPQARRVHYLDKNITSENGLEGEPVRINNLTATDSYLI